ncbi:XdhC family protein [Colwellia sp. BRX10-6]|uniref:XdhC family protein n=1 Tax=unclassified Colwellia TaxID=196834 RepID=UPI0015F6C49B|nr:MULTISPECIES: XdhC/CoxI family protein [unclassified Colwellia]MBA6381747.1 XdhC family protein [Colwellia sp. BRX10-9]MBA6395614.1 XdhC family protein [Colwellia sp. BRX10-6]
MSNHLSHLLAQWYPHRDNADWVLATIYQTEGPCYRKPGAMMLFSSQGDQLGMLSGGCLESDIGVNARKVMQTNKSMLVCYDGTDEDDLSFHLGIGCGGTIYIMLQQVHAANAYLSLAQVYDALKHRISGYLYQSIVEQGNDAQAYFEAKKVTNIAATATLIPSPLNNDDKTNWLATPIVPEPHLLVVGGGIDARPLVNMAEQLGWKVSLWDPRPANARKEYFSNVSHIIKGEAEVLTTFAAEKDVNAAILMSHNVSIDAAALKALANTNIQYLALLGPNNRKQQVITQAEVVEQSLSFTFAGPAGLEIGGTLPESIALSILAECHASLFNKSAQSISHVL